MINYKKVWELHAHEKMPLSEIARLMNITEQEAKAAMMYCWRSGKSCNLHYDREYEARHSEK